MADLLELDSLHKPDESGSEDLIDDFMTMWDEGLPGGTVLMGRILEESQPAIGQSAATKRNLYNVRMLDGRVIPDCILLSPLAYGTHSKNSFDADQLPGMYAKPYPGSFCVLVSTHGGTLFIIGFYNPPSTVATANDENTSETKPGSVEDVEARNPGDWIVRTENAYINCKRMGAIQICSGASIRQTMNPLDGVHFSQCKYRIDVAEGYQLRRGRITKTEPEALSTEDFYDKILQRGRQSVRVRIRNGEMDDDVRREVLITEVDFATPTDPIETDLFKQTVLADGKWRSVGPEYRWGGDSANQQLVLGNALVSTIKKLTSLIRSLKVMTAWGTSSPPLNATQFTTDIDNKLDDILCDYMYLTKEPVEP